MSGQRGHASIRGGCGGEACVLGAIVRSCARRVRGRNVCEPLVCVSTVALTTAGRSLTARWLTPAGRLP